MAGVPSNIAKVNRSTADRTAYLYAQIVTVTVQGSGIVNAASPWFNFGGIFITEPAGGILPQGATDASGNPIPDSPIALKASITYATTANGALYTGAYFRVFSMKDVGDFYATINAVFIGRGYKIEEEEEGETES